MTVDRLDRSGESQVVDVHVPVGSLDGEPVVGISVQDYVAEPDFPVEITLNTERVTGPSAGLAFTLAIIDHLSLGDITGGVDVAATGTIGLDGTVGAVGGVRDKTKGALRAGASLLLVPASEVDQAEPVAGSLRVVGVETIDDALAALASIGGAEPGAPATPSTTALAA